MNHPPCFICRSASYWRGTVGTSFRYACSEHRNRLQLLVRPVPFQPSHVRLVARGSGVRRAASPDRVEASVPPRSGNFGGDAA